MRRSVLFILLLIISDTVNAQSISPYDYGLNEAKTGVEKYNVLLQTHIAAIEKGCGVSYSGVEKLTIEIPPHAPSIYLSNYTDFAGLELTVINNDKNMPVFVMSNEAKDVYVTKKKIKKGRYGKNNNLCKGTKLLIVEDKTPWVKNRKGHDYGAIRRDVILIKEGRAQNETIQPYSNPTSDPIAFYYEVDEELKEIKNLHFIRHPGNKYVASLFSVTGVNNLLISNVTIDTPFSNLVADRAISVNNSANVTMDNVTINDTYSQTNKFGYGISMNTVWNIKFSRLMAKGKWGVFGNNNVNTVIMENSDINRFDIHCYGKDVFFKNTIFRDLYNQFSSFYGTLSFNGCKFLKFVPVLFESSYRAYTHFDLVFKDCMIDIDSARPYIISAGRLEIAEGARDELTQVEWPNVKMTNVTISAEEEVKRLTLFEISGRDNSVVGGIESIEMESITFTKAKPQIVFSNKQVKTNRKLFYRVNSSDINELKK